mmetsp:Transcript_8826/g.23910  ORF Transcript_8826/g.23910 Transcript_8826/m.23910 type:complete len:659 (-) Transcript_8826:238-2214(-)
MNANGSSKVMPITPKDEVGDVSEKRGGENAVMNGGGVKEKRYAGPYLGRSGRQRAAEAVIEIGHISITADPASIKARIERKGWVNTYTRKYPLPFSSTPPWMDEEEGDGGGGEIGENGEWRGGGNVMKGGVSGWVAADHRVGDGQQERYEGSSVEGVTEAAGKSEYNMMGKYESEKEKDIENGKVHQIEPTDMPRPSLLSSSNHQYVRAGQESEETGMMAGISPTAYYRRGVASVHSRKVSKYSWIAMMGGMYMTGLQTRSPRHRVVALIGGVFIWIACIHHVFQLCLLFERAVREAGGTSLITALTNEITEPFTAMVMIYLLWTLSTAACHTTWLAQLKGSKLESALMTLMHTPEDFKYISTIFPPIFIFTYTAGLSNLAFFAYSTVGPFQDGLIGPYLLVREGNTSTYVYAHSYWDETVPENPGNGTLIALTALYPFSRNIFFIVFIFVLLPVGTLIWLLPVSALTSVCMVAKRKITALADLLRAANVRLTNGEEAEFELVRYCVKQVEATFSGYLTVMIACNLPLIIFTLYRLILQSVDTTFEALTLLMWLTFTSIATVLPILTAASITSSAATLRGALLDGCSEELAFSQLSSQTQQRFYGFASRLGHLSPVFRLGGKRGVTLTYTLLFQVVSVMGAVFLLLSQAQSSSSSVSS